MLKYNIDTDIKVRKPEDLLVTLSSVITVNKFDDEATLKFRKEFYEAVNGKQPVIPIVIDSYGGSCYSVLSMVSTIKQSPVPVATIVTGKAMSAGAILLSCGTNGYRFY